MTEQSGSKPMAAIRSTEDIEIELATRPALRLWKGREKSETRHSILGLPGFSKIVRGIEQAIKEDDPYADFHYHKIEAGIEDLTFDLNRELKDIESFIHENVPRTMRVPDAGSERPEVIPIRFASQLGFKIVYQLLKVDQIVLKVLQANHIGLLPNKEKFETIARVEKRVRSVLQMVFLYRHTGVTRDDIASNNQKAQNAKALMGELSASYADGSQRSENAPPLPLKRLQTLGKIMDAVKSKPKGKTLISAGQVLDKEALGAELDRVFAEAEDEALVAEAKKLVAG